MNAGLLSRFQQNLRRFARDESGATAIEYSLIVGLIFLAIAAAVNSFASSTSDMYGTIVSATTPQ